jgi:alpha-tubulin suppressor-like RCC1 family protein
VRCWGHGQAGQLGTGSGSDSNTAAVVPALAGGAKLATGYNHACARRADGALACWGASDVGQLGNGSYDDSNVPVAVSGLSKVLDVAAGAGHTCAVLDDGSASVACWGDDRRGQLGDGVTALRVPVAPRLACP